MNLLTSPPHITPSLHPPHSTSSLHPLTSPHDSTPLHHRITPPLTSPHHSTPLHHPIPPTPHITPSVQPHTPPPHITPSLISFLDESSVFIFHWLKLNNMFKNITAEELVVALKEAHLLFHPGKVMTDQRLHWRRSQEERVKGEERKWCVFLFRRMEKDRKMARFGF